MQLLMQLRPYKTFTGPLFAIYRLGLLRVLYINILNSQECHFAAKTVYDLSKWVLCGFTSY